MRVSVRRRSGMEFRFQHWQALPKPLLELVGVREQVRPGWFHVLADVAAFIRLFLIKVIIIKVIIGLKLVAQTLALASTLCTIQKSALLLDSPFAASIS